MSEHPPSVGPHPSEEIVDGEFEDIRAPETSSAEGGRYQVPARIEPTPEEVQQAEVLREHLDTQGRPEAVIAPEAATTETGTEPAAEEGAPGIGEGRERPEISAEDAEKAARKEREARGEEAEKPLFKEKFEATVKKRGKAMALGALALSGGGTGIVAAGLAALTVGGLGMATSNIFGLGVLTSPGLAGAFVGGGAIALGGGIITALLGNVILDIGVVQLIKSFWEHKESLFKEITGFTLGGSGSGSGKKSGGDHKPAPAHH